MAKRSREHRQDIPGYNDSRPTREERKQQHRAVRHHAHQVLHMTDDPDADAPNCSQVWEEQFNLFGFPPDSTQFSATYHDAPRSGQGQISGISAESSLVT